MRYESFYPFARQQPSPPPTGHSGFGLPPQMGQRQAPRQPFPNGPMNNPFGGPGPDQNPQQSPSKMDTYMQTANRFLNTAQQFAPVVQQFAPMIQNLPAMWRLYKGFQSLPPANGGPATGGATNSAPVARSAGPAASAGISVPRIFQPPNQ